MKRQLLILLAFAVVLGALPVSSALAANGRGRAPGVIGRGGGMGGRGFGGRGFGGLGFGGGFGDFGGYGGYGGYDIAELYRQLYNNLPYFALHPPVYYSYPVPRTYGYSPFAYMPDVMTPDVSMDCQPLEIINPYVPSSQQKAPEAPANKTAEISNQPQPLVILNPYVQADKAVAQAE